MIKINKSTNITGNSTIDVTENGTTITKQIAYMNATVSEGGNVNINKSIQDTALFTANKDAVLADFTEFETYVYSLVG